MRDDAGGDENVMFQNYYYSSFSWWCFFLFVPSSLAAVYDKQNMNLNSTRFACLQGALNILFGTTANVTRETQ